jgi:hypothetical protein
MGIEYLGGSGGDRPLGRDNVERTPLAGVSARWDRAMGRTVRFSLTLVMLVGMVLGSTAVLPDSASADGIWVQVTTDIVNVRETPNGTIIGQASWGQSFEVVGGPTPDNWYKIDYYGVHGFVLGDYIGAGLSTNGVGSTSEADSGDAAGAPAVSGRWVDVDRSSQLVTLYEGDVPVVQVWAAMSSDQSASGFWATANGSYQVFAKEQALHYTPYGRAWIRDYVAFDPARDNGFHSYSLESWGSLAHGYNDPTGGCVALDLWAAEYLFSFVSIGTPVEVHW